MTDPYAKTEVKVSAQDGWAQFVHHVEEEHKQLHREIQEINRNMQQLLGERALIRWSIGLATGAILLFGSFLTVAVFNGQARDGVQDHQIDTQGLRLEEQSYRLDGVQAGVADLKSDIREMKVILEEVAKSVRREE